MRRPPGFTIVEVILAILIISGIMTVLLYFYQRSSQVRQGALEEAEFLSVTRLVLEQISMELRTARPVEDQFIHLEGSSNSISFVCTSIPQMARWISSTNDPVVLPPSTDLRRVTYRLLDGTNTLGMIGIERTETLVLGLAFTAGTNLTDFVEPGETNLATEVEVTAATTNLLRVAAPPLTDRIQFLQFRYWDGTAWVEQWSGMQLPAGVEISLGREPMPLDGAGEMYPFELFRRVVYLPHSIHPGNQVQLEEPQEFTL